MPCTPGAWRLGSRDCGLRGLGVEARALLSRNRTEMHGIYEVYTPISQGHSTQPVDEAIFYVRLLRGAIRERGSDDAARLKSSILWLKR